MPEKKSQRNINVLKEGTKRVKGKDAFEKNVEALKAVAESIKSSLGPKGLNKMIVDTLGDVVVTGDGAKILEEMQIENPAAKMLVDLAKTIKKNYGDGVTSAVIFVGELMDRAEELVSMDIAPIIINDGFQKALIETKKLLDQYAIKVDLQNQDLLEKVVSNGLNTKNIDSAKNKFSSMIVETLNDIVEKRGDRNFVDLDNIQYIKKEGENISKTKLIEGIIIDKEIVNPMMPRRLHDARIALIDGSLEIVKTDISSEIEISNTDEISNFLNQEKSLIKENIDKIVDSGANVVFCQKGIDETAQNFLQKNNILAVRRIKHSDMKKLAKATKANIVTQVKNISKSDLGKAQLVSEKKIGSDKMVFVEGCTGPKAITMLIRGGTELIVDDAERAIKNSVSILKSIFEHPHIIPGGGSTEIQIRKSLLRYAEKIGGKQQLAIEAFADSLEAIPKYIIENSGKDPLDLITALRSKIDFSQNNYKTFDSFTGNIVDAKQEGIYEPMHIKRNIYAMATELATIFIRIDEYIKSSSNEK